LYFRQFVGRVARNGGTEFDQEPYVFMPKHGLQSPQDWREVGRTEVAQLPNHRICIKMMIDAMPPKVCSATTLTPRQARPSV
jgi:hypothetical protein